MFFAGEYGEEGKGYRPYSGFYNELLKRRKIFLIGDVDREISSHIVSLLIYLNDENNKEKITLYINSAGGDIVEGLFAVFDTIQMIEAPVETICIGEASSSAAIILASGSRGMRKATQNATIMIHQIQVEGIEGTGSMVAKEIKEIKSLNKRMMEILSLYCSQPYKKVYRDCKDDKILTAEQALKYGIIDEIITPSKLVPSLKKANKPASNQHEC